MKIACIGNMNNMMFTLCRYLKDNDIDATLFLLKDEPFLPADDSNEKDEIHIITLPISASNFSKKRYKHQLRKFFNNYNFFIGTDIAPAVLASIGLKLNVFVPHGSDIYSFPFVSLSTKFKKNEWWLKEKYLMGKLQKIGIENTPHIIFPDEYDIHFPFKNKLNTKGHFYNMTIPMVYHKDLKETNDLASLNYKNTFLKLREDNDLMIFSHSRQNGVEFKKGYDIHNKGNDILIEGFALFVKKNPNVKAVLILFEYGMNIEYSKALIKKINIQNYVKWMPKMKRKDIMFGISISDIGCGQFKNSWLTCGVVNEVLSLNIPLLHYRKDTLYKDDYKELYPILNASTVFGIAEKLNEFISFKKNHVKPNSSEWIEKYTVKRPVSFIIKQINLSKEVRLNNLNILDKLLVLVIKKHTILLILINKIRIKLSL